ncbi:hypothetical protein [Sinorhizobium medicae]
MKNWLLGGLYLFVALSSLSGVLFGGAAFFLYRFYDDRDPSRAVICEKSGGTAPECAMPESADKVLDALITCGIDFFDVLKEEKAVFLHVRKVFHVNSYGDGQHRETNVIFRQPIEAYGLRLTGYTHSASIPAFIWKPTRYSWGFQVTGLPEEAARAIEMRHPQIEKFKEFFGAWIQESAFTAPASFSIVFHRNEPFPGTYLECKAGEEVSASLGKLPAVSSLFQLTGM